MRTARAKGLNPNLVLFKHGLQNALIPVVTLAGIFLAVVLGGVVAVEIVFGIRGLGRLLIGSINRRDFPVIQGTVIVISFAFVFMNLIVDVLYTMINPRIQYGGGE
jgi:peptide/nickel transport system permease protein